VQLCGAYKGCFRPAPGHQNIITIETQKEKLKQQEEPRDFLCKVSNAFRISAKRSSMLLGSAWTFASAVLIIVMRRPHTTLEALKNTLTAPRRRCDKSRE
jgi:hypothetical protein